LEHKQNVSTGVPGNVASDADTVPPSNQQTFSDVQAAAEYLVKNSYAGEKKVTVYGGSNGGVTALRSAQQKPELFGAVLAAVGVLVSAFNAIRPFGKSSSLKRALTGSLAIPSLHDWLLVGFRLWTVR
jgi:dienelactone hydrolase